LSSFNRSNRVRSYKSGRRGSQGPSPSSKLPSCSGKASKKISHTFCACPVICPCSQQDIRADSIPVAVVRQRGVLSLSSMIASSTSDAPTALASADGYFRKRGGLSALPIHPSVVYSTFSGDTESSHNIPVPRFPHGSQREPCALVTWLLLLMTMPSWHGPSVRIFIVTRDLANLNVLFR